MTANLGDSHTRESAFVKRKADIGLETPPPSQVNTTPVQYKWVICLCHSCSMYDLARLKTGALPCD